jgi:hypothetical protein
MNGSPWVKNLFHPLAVGVMFGCIALSLVNFIRLFVPTWNGTYLIAGCVLAALEANYSYRLIRARQLRGTDALRFRAVEVAMFFILLKIGGYAGDTWADILRDIRTWPRQPFAAVDPETTAAFILALLSWWASTQTTRDLERLGKPPERSRYYVSPSESLARRFYRGGAVLLLVAGLNRIGIAQLLDLRRPSVPGLVLNVLVYFLLGLAMLGQMQFTRLRKRWQAQRIKIARELPGRWVRYSLALIGLAAVMAFVLPTGYTVGLLDVIGGMLELTVGVLTFALQLLLLLITLVFWPLSLLLSLLHGTPAPRPRPTLPAVEPPRERFGGLGLSWFETLRSLLFWAFALGVVFYVIRSYLRDHPELLQGLAALKPVQALRRLLIALWRRLAGLAKAVNERLPLRLSLRRRGPRPSGERFGFLRLGALSPRERILYYYLSILRRAGQRGFPRHRGQTPYEYDVTLGPHLPQARREMSLLTQAFVEARYSTHAVDQERARQVRSDWQQVKTALRALKRGMDAGHPSGADAERSERASNPAGGGEAPEGV